MLKRVIFTLVETFESYVDITFSAVLSVKPYTVSSLYRRRMKPWDHPSAVFCPSSVSGFWDALRFFRVLKQRR
jgi:hypothetical protein